ncbi:MAG TPA: PAS domain-containing protein [Methylomirabilota bacterium]|nr:PAS domain-containing protein [Methylomirabilota bacterium]
MAHRVVMRRFPWLAAALWAVVVLASLPGAALVLLSLQRGPDPVIIALAGMVVVAALAAALAVQVLVVAPLRKVLTTVHRITEADFSARSHARGRTEIDRVLRALDDLAGQLATRLATAQAGERRFHLLYDDNPAGLFRTRPDGRVVDCNPAVARLLGYEGVREVKLRNATAFYANPPDRQWVLDRLEREGAIASLPLYLRRKDGQMLPALVSLTRTHEGGETYMDGSIVDLRETAGSERVGPGGDGVQVPA